MVCCTFYYWRHLAVNFLDLKLKHFTSTYSTTLNGPPCKAKYSDLTSRPKVATDYLRHAPKLISITICKLVQLHWRMLFFTKASNLCQFTGITGFLFPNAHLAYCHVRDKTMSHTNFKKTLSNELHFSKYSY